MKQNIFTLLAVCFFTLTSYSQETVFLPFEKTPDFTWKGEEVRYFSEKWKTELITNVSKPSILIYKPSKRKNNGSTVIIAPGGALFALSIINEGTKVAEWLTKKGFTAVVLKYRLIPTYTNDGVTEQRKINRKNKTLLQENVTKLIPYSINDGLTAIDYMRTHAKEYNIDPNKIGFMGFSAGGAVTMGVSYNYTPKNRPNFIAPVYPWTAKYPVQKPKQDAPPMIVFCASDDQLKLAPGNIELYQSWLDAKLNASIHMYSKGKHGFGMKKQNLPSDYWIEHFYQWAISEGFVTP